MSFIQPKNLEIFCSLDIFLDGFDSKISFKDPKLGYWNIFEMNQPQTYREQFCSMIGREV